MACTCAEDGLIRTEDGVTVRIQVRGACSPLGRGHGPKPD